LGGVVGAINDVVDATRVIEVARREKEGILKASSEHESGLAQLYGEWSPEKMEIELTTKKKEGKEETKMISQCRISL
jgi:hypothetical protein